MTLEMLDMFERNMFSSGEDVGVYAGGFLRDAVLRRGVEAMRTEDCGYDTLELMDCLLIGCIETISVCGSGGRLGKMNGLIAPSGGSDIIEMEYERSALERLLWFDSVCAC